MRAAGVLSVCLGLAVCVFCGCLSPLSGNPGGSVEPLQRSALAYLAKEPFHKITIEIDAVRGCEPKEKDIEGLVGFLETYCEKPVTVMRKKPIPRAAAKGVRPQLLAFMNMHGSPEDDPDEPSAYLYVLFYAGPVNERSRVVGAYPCAIWMNVSNFWITRWMLAPALRHEAGHVLGLCANKTHGDGAHCRVKGCLMRGISITGSLLGTSGVNLCQMCQEDLRQRRQSGETADLQFKGPFLIRRGEGYFVAMLPAFRALSLAPEEDFDWKETLAMRTEWKNETEKKDPEGYARLLTDPGAGFLVVLHPIITRPADVDRLLPAAEAASNDPDPSVAKLARDWIETQKANLPLLDAADEDER